MSISNCCTFRANLVKDPESVRIKSTSGEEITKTSFRIAVNNRRGDATFLDVESFRGRAETIAETLHKGDEVWVMGELRIESWVDKDGNNRSRLFLNLDGFEYGRARREKTSDDVPEEIEE